MKIGERNSRKGLSLFFASREANLARALHAGPRLGHLIKGDNFSTDEIEPAIEFLRGVIGSSKPLSPGPVAGWVVTDHRNYDFDFIVELPTNHGRMIFEFI
ncbi:MAG: hypothetical protein WAM39_32940 [Bryobacteraceae bacterium]